MQSGGRNPIQDCLLYLCGLPCEDELDVVLGHAVDVLSPAGVVTEIFSGERCDLQQGEGTVAVHFVVLVVVRNITLAVVLSANLQLSVPPSYGGVWIRCGWN